MPKALRKIRQLLEQEEFTSDDLGLWYQILRDGICPFCGGVMTEPETSWPKQTDATKDHIIPRCAGGETRVENVVIVCSACNGRKADMSLLECLVAGGLTHEPPELGVDGQESQRRAIWLGRMSVTYFGATIFTRKTSAARKMRAMIAWIGLNLDARPHHIARMMKPRRRDVDVAVMSRAWERKAQTRWAKRQVRVFIAYLQRQLNRGDRPWGTDENVVSKQEKA